MKRILIIEDEPSIAQLQRDYMEINGFQADIAGDGETGLIMGLSGKYDLIVLDLMLPRMSGFEVCRLIREELDIPVLMVTARREDIDVIKGLGLGADDYIVKPFKPAQLAARVKAHLARYERLIGRSASREVNVQGLRIDPDSRRVYVQDAEVILTTKEFDLLYFLAS